MTEHKHRQDLEGSQKPVADTTLASKLTKALLVTLLIIILAANFIVFNGFLSLHDRVVARLMPALWIAMLIIVSTNIVMLTPPDENGKPKVYPGILVVLINLLGFFLLPLVIFFASIYNGNY